MNREFKYWLITMSLCILIVALFVFIGTYTQNKRQNDKIIKEEIVKDSLISQNKMQEIYGWNKVILWSESKDDFEKAYHTKLTWINYPMEFVKHPDCIDPLGGSSEWRDDKICFYYRFPSGKPEIPNLIAKESEGKTLVVIGTLYANGKRISGSVYWY